MASDLRLFAENLLKERGLDLVLSGPYRWGAADAPRIGGVYLAQSLPPVDRLVFFLGTERDFNRLKSSTLILIDELGPELVALTPANDEG
jgi:hypothetical protein